MSTAAFIRTGDARRNGERCVVIADSEIISPIDSRTERAVAMNQPSLDKFEPAVKPGGLIVNKSIVERGVRRDDVRAVYVPSLEIASELGNIASPIWSCSALTSKRQNS